jgi:hypothetical protein
MRILAAVLYLIRFGLIGLFGVLFPVTLFRPICFIGSISLLPKRLALLVHRNGTTKV